MPVTTESAIAARIRARQGESIIEKASEEELIYKVTKAVAHTVNARMKPLEERRKEIQQALHRLENSKSTKG
jgi:Mg2+ and Co2+ transporter CorA